MIAYLSKRLLFLATSFILTSCKIDDNITGCYVAELSKTYGYSNTTYYELRISHDSLVSLAIADECGLIINHKYKLHRISENLYNLKSLINDSSSDHNTIPLTIKKNRFFAKKYKNIVVEIKGLYKNYDWYIYNSDTSYFIINNNALIINNKASMFRIMGIRNELSCLIDYDTVFSIPFSFNDNYGHFTIKMGSFNSCMVSNQEKNVDIVTFITPTIIQIKNRDLFLKKTN